MIQIWVKKDSGNYQTFEEHKIKSSVIELTKRVGIVLKDSDLAIVLSYIEGSICAYSKSSSVITSKEIRKIVEQALDLVSLKDSSKYKSAKSKRRLDRCSN